MVRNDPLHIVVLLHGIRTHAEWQRSLAGELALAGLAPLPISYGVLNLARFLWPTSRKKVYQWFLDEMTSLKDRLIAGDRVSIVAHSFGTLIVGRALSDPDLPSFPFKVERVIFCGAILPSDGSTISAIADKCSSLLNDFSRRDVWARAARWVVSEAGNSGFYGFGSIHAKLQQKRHEQLGHSAYFTRQNFRERWAPFISGTVLRDSTYQSLGTQVTSSKNLRPWLSLGVGSAIAALLLWYSMPVLLPKARCAGTVHDEICSSNRLLRVLSSSC
jgi:pimeloyl-ACP methyl ester carboxylesterase